MANGDYIQEIHIREFLRRMKEEHPNDYDIVLEIEKKLYGRDSRT
jgi:hypothetical protein